MRRAQEQHLARQRAKRRDREMAAVEVAEQTERSRREEAVAGQRAKRDREVRAQAYEVKQRLAAARRTAEEADTDLEIACGKLAAGAITVAEVERVQSVRDEARRTLELWELAAGSFAMSGALAGRR